MAQGYNNTTIAQRLVVSPKSVEAYINVTYQKLNLFEERELNSRVRAILLYLEESQDR